MYFNSSRDMAYMKMIMKRLISIFFISSLFIYSTQAEVRYYRYDSDMPFIEMMLNMMVAMGMIDRIPPGFINRGGYYPRPYRPHNYPYQYESPDYNYSYEMTIPPCEGEFCSNNNTNHLNGLWITPHGEMLGINDQKFLWSDGYSKYLAGYVKAKEDMFSLKVLGNGMVLSYQYKLDNNRLQTRDEKGVIRSFIKAPMQ